MIGNRDYTEIVRTVENLFGKGSNLWELIKLSYNDKKFISNVTTNWVQVWALIRFKPLNDRDNCSEFLLCKLKT